MGRTLSEAIEETLGELESKDARWAARFRQEIEAATLEHPTTWREAPDTPGGTVFGELLARMQSVLDRLSQPKVHTLGDEIDETLRALEEKNPKAAEGLREEYNSTLMEHDSSVLQASGTGRGTVFGDILARMREALEA
jgi:hypothetical protein